MFSLYLVTFENSMKSYIITLIVILFTTNHSKTSEEIVKEYLFESNNYRFERASLFLDSNYKEVFIDGSVEIGNLNQLKDFMAWRKIMNSKSTILSINNSNDTVITVERTHHIMDEILDRKSRTFKIKYLVKNDKILKSIIDTLPGYSEIMKFNNAKFNEFLKFCDEKGLESKMGLTADGALKLRRALELYKNRH